MIKITTDRLDLPADSQRDPEALDFQQQFGDRSPLDEIVQEGARRMLQAAIDAEVESFIEDHQHRRDESGRRLVVKNGSRPAREILTGAGPIPVKQGRVRDNSPDRKSRVEFSPSILPVYLKRTDAIEELIPWLYLKGISTSDFGEALQALVGEKAKGLRACESISRLPTIFRFGFLKFGAMSFQDFDFSAFILGRIARYGALWAGMGR